MDNNVLIAIISLLGGVATGILGLWVAVYTGKVELKKRAPETITHHCRIAKFDIYTFITGKKTQTPPVCPYLDGSDHITCHFIPNIDQGDVLKMKEANSSKCYIALFARKFDLE